MRIGLIDVDSHHFPNLPLMKLSAWHKEQGDAVEWYDPLTAWMSPYDRVYASKVFTFTPDYEHPICADEIIRGGTGYGIADSLPDEIEHIYPDYSIYPQFSQAYGFLTRGCPRGCDFCVVGDKEGRRSYKVANLSEFWNGQKAIKLLDPNMFASPDWRGLSGQLIESGAWIDFTQGCDMRIMTAEKAEMIRRMRIKEIHFAWDRYEDKEIILPKFREFREITGWDRHKMVVYVLINYDTVLEQDLERVYTLRDLGFSPYVMIYEKEKLEHGSALRKLQRYVNARWIFNSVERFEDYERRMKE